MKLFRKLRALFRQEKLDRDMDEEMRFHLQERAADHETDGLSPDEARYAAQRKFGGVEQIKERVREQRSWAWIEHLFQDVSYAARALRKNPGFAAVAIATLALGIGANTAIFSFANALLFRSLPAVDSSGLVQFRSRNGDESFSYRSYQRFREHARTLDNIALLQRTPEKRALIATGFGSAGAEAAETQAVSGSFFSTLGVSASLGRTFSVDDDRPESPQPVAVLSHAYWQRRFGGDPQVLGKVVRVDGVALTIVGVTPPGFNGFVVGARPDLWWPVAMFPQLERDPGADNRLKAQSREWALLIGRIRAGVTHEQAQAELRTLFQADRIDLAARATHWTEKQRRDYLSRELELTPAGTGFSRLRKHLLRPLTILAAIVVSVLLIACANVAGLLLARGAAREREFAVRAALGASRGRIMRQLVTESLLLALLSGAGGLLLAQVGTVFLLRYLAGETGAFDVPVDGRMLLFTFAISTVTGVLFGLVPALRLSRSGAAVTAKAAAGGSRSRLNQSLVVLQIALSVALLAGAGLFVRSLQKLRAADLGFEPERVVRITLEFGSGYTLQQRASAHQRVLDRLATLPEIRSATVSGAGLLGGDGFVERIAVDGYTPQVDEDMRTLAVVAGPRFFETLGIPLRAGRGFTSADEVPVPPGGATSPRIAVVGETFARRFFGNADPVGRTVRFGANPRQPPLVIIGVAKDVKYRTLREKNELVNYVPYFGGVLNMPMTVLVSTHENSRMLDATIRTLVGDVDPGVVVTEIVTMDDVVGASLRQERMVAHLGGFFGLFALILASLGLYGMLSFGVVQRTREIGVRMALGAQQRQVLGLVVGQGVKLALIGIGAGLLVALATTHFASKLLYGIPPDDPVTFAGVAAILLGVATLAAWLPARRAAKVDPMIALRCE